MLFSGRVPPTNGTDEAKEVEIFRMIRDRAVADPSFIDVIQNIVADPSARTSGRLKERQTVIDELNAFLD